MDEKIVVKNQTFIDLLSTFSGYEECYKFFDDFEKLMVNFQTITLELMDYVKSPLKQDDVTTIFFGKMILLISIFFRDNVEVLNELMKKLEYKRVSE